MTSPSSTHPQQQPSFSSSASTITNPPQISDFKFIKQISAGAFGTVHLATHPCKPSHAPYAIKKIKKSDLIRKNLTDKLLEERSALLKSRAHEFCVKLYYSLQTNAHVYFIMEYCIGGDLKSLLSQMNFFPPQMASFYIGEVALALNYLHSKSIIHRDIKPDNMLIHKSGHIKLTDFGLSDVGLKSNMSPPAAGSSPFTPGQLASLAQPLTFSHCGHGQDSYLSVLSPIISNASPSALQTNQTGTPSTSLHRLSSSSSIHPIQHSTPVGSLATQNIPSILHTKHRKVRIPLRKLGSRTHLTSTSNDSSALSISSNSSSSSASLSSSWSIISTTEQGNDDNKENEDAQHEFNFKRVRLSPPSTSHPSKPYAFETSSFLNVSFNFSEQQKPLLNNNKLTPPPRNSLQLSRHSPQQNSPRTPSTSSSQLIPHQSFSTPPQTTQVTPPHQQKSTFTASLENNNNNSSVHASPETGRLQHRTPSTNNFFTHHPHGPGSSQTNAYCSLPAMVLQKSPPPVSAHHHHHPPNFHHLLSDLKEESGSQLPSFLAVKSPPMIKSPTWPQPDSMIRWGSNRDEGGYKTDKKRKRGSEQHQMMSHHHQQPSKSTGLTLEFSAIHLPSSSAAVVTPPPVTGDSGGHSGQSVMMYSTPVNNGCSNVRLLGTPDYLSPELIRNAMDMMGGSEQDQITEASDWWSLGVCFYEFVIGVLPFNDDSPQQIFSNILDREIEYPEGLDEDLVCVMDGLICSDVGRRFRLEELKAFTSVFGSDGEWWGRLNEMEPPFVPVTDGEMDTGYFGGV